jgi:hypothetical protein
LIVARLALHVSSYAAMRRALDRLPRRSTASPMNAVECEQAVRRAGRIVPGASCLACAFAAACLLRREGHDSTLTLGVRFGPGHRLLAHAWLESGGCRITGGPETSEHRVLLRDMI